MSKAVKRQYNSTRRQEQAAQTRLRIISAAHDLFVANGYGRTTIAEIALTAGVAVETVYAAFRNKHTLLRHVWFVSSRGYDEDVRLLDRPEVRALLAEPDLATRFDQHAVFVTALFRRIAPLLSALQGARERTRGRRDARRVGRAATRRMQDLRRGRLRNWAARGQRGRVP